MTAIDDTLVQLSDIPERTPLVALTGAADMHAALAELHARWGQVAPVDLEPGVPGWLVMGHRELCDVMRNEGLFSRDPRNWRWYYDGILPLDSGLRSILSTGRRAAYYSDGPEHRRLRAPLDDAFSSIDEQRTAAMVRAVCNGLIEQFGERGRADLISEYAVAVSFLSAAGMFGFREQDGMALLRCVGEIFGHGGDPVTGLAEMDAIVLAHVTERRARPTEDLTSVFVAHPNFEDDEEIVHSMVVGICAANEMLVSWIAAALRLMMTDPRYTGRVSGPRRGLDDALDETLWREPPIASLPARFALTDCELDGKLIREGDALVMGVAAANADPRVHSEDEWFETGNRSHVSFGVGPHACPAPRAGRLIVKIAVESLVQRLDLRPAEPDVAWAPSPWSRYPAVMPVVFTPTSGAVRVRRRPDGV
ncbi:cytochrome P450 [Antribacter sp. KLBMP9083]|uniref:Cytochrome P450 n=1 Tax=Antribacter soli TaxID=2910976 RepID=A0AA41UA62_9MICO|nr:cytochrome P450 [Antribacter soli]MCF4122297.1 cytochrome P450 [Antribacter soli]